MITRIETRSVSPLDTAPVAGPITPRATGRTATEAMPGPLAAMQESNDPGAEIAALLVLSAREGRKGASAARAAAEASERAAFSRRVAAMREKADASLVAGVVKGVGMAAAGAGTMVSAASQLRTIEEANKMKLVGPAFDKASSHAKAFGGVFEASGKLAETAGHGIATGFEYAAKGHEEQATKAEFATSLAGREIDRQSKEIEDADSLLGRAIEFYKAYRTAKSETAAAAIRG